jgi:Protein of unknown function (DUF3108)
MRPRRGRLLALVAAVTALHLAMLPAVWPVRLGDGAAADASSRPQRLAVNFVQTLQPREPAAAPPLARLARALPAAGGAVAGLAAEPAASAAEAAAVPASAPLLALRPPLVAAASASSPPAQAAASAPPAELRAAAPAASAVPASTPDATAFDWPPSTRLSYRVTGHVQGPVEGDARVEWLRQGLRYQVHLDMTVALLASRRISSDGVITPSGLAPHRYDEETRIVLREPRRVALEFGPEQVRMADGRLLPRPEGVQDSASQFVQMTWLLNARPELRQTGASVAFPLALPRRIDPWIYDIADAGPVLTPAGELQALHVKPRREAGGGDLTVELWVAPSLQFLPVRLLIRQGQAVRLELLLDRLPEQAAPGR